MRWLLPLVLALVLALALALAGIDDSSLGRKRVRRTSGSDGRELADPSHPGRAAARHDDRASTWQRGTFDGATGTLTWFDDVYN
jgi:hypothetical protein